MKHLGFAFALLIPAVSMAQESHLPVEKIWAERDSAGTYKIEASDKTPWSVYKGKSTDQISWTNKIGVAGGKTLEQKSNRSERLFFAAVHKKDTLYFAERRLAMDASPNFRDLGGLKTSDGRTVKWGKLFRSGDMGNLSERDLHIGEYGTVDHLNSGIKIISFWTELTSIND